VQAYPRFARRFLGEGGQYEGVEQDPLSVFYQIEIDVGTSLVVREGGELHAAPAGFIEGKKTGVANVFDFYGTIILHNYKCNLLSAPVK
jgi:hypothetical protein